MLKALSIRNLKQNTLIPALLLGRKPHKKKEGLSPKPPIFKD